ncbi:MAG: TolC family protein [PVC group bacterium]
MIFIQGMRRLLPLFLLAACPVFLSAEEAEVPLTWEECVASARQHNPGLKAAEAAVEQASATKGKTRSSLLPSVSFGLDADRSKTSGDDPGDSYGYSLSARQLLFDGLKSWYDLDQSDRDFISSLYSYDVTSSTIRLNLATAFIELLRSQGWLEISRDIIRRRSQQLEMVKLRYEAGREHKGALMTSRANYAQAEFDLTQARRDILLARQQLVKEMGLTDVLPYRAEGDLAVAVGVAGDQDPTRLAASHPAVLMMTARKEAAEYAVKSAWSQFFPEVYGTARIGRSDSEWPPASESWALGISLSLPLFEGGGRIEEKIRASAALRGAAEEERSELDGVLYTLRERWKDLNDAVDRLTVQKMYLDADQERSRIAEAQYGNGLLTFDNWIIIEDNLVRTKKTYLEAQAAALAAQARWLNAQGVPLVPGGVFEGSR